jgi:signal transduction histidine kinase/Tfp pilus assembly protein PilF
MANFPTAKYLLLCMIGNSIQSFAIETDSLKTLLSQTTNDSVYVDILNKLSKSYRWNEPLTAMDYAVKAEKLSEPIHYREGIALAYHNIGAIYADKSNNELALEYYQKSLKINELLNDHKAMADVLGNLGLIFRRQRNYERSLEFQNRSLKLYREMNDSIGISNCYGNIGLIYTDQGKFDKALIQYYNGLRMKESLRDKMGMANAYGNIGYIYLKINSIDQAKVNMERSLGLFEEIDNKTGIAEACLYLGDIYQLQKETDKAIKTFRKCFQIYRDKGNPKGMADASLKLGTIYYSIKLDTLALFEFQRSLDLYMKANEVEGIIDSKIWLSRYLIDQEIFDQAGQKLNDALRVAQKEHFYQQEYEILGLLAIVHMHWEDYQAAAQYLSKSKALADTIYNRKLDKEVTQLQMQYDFDKKMAEKEFEEKTQKIQNDLQIKRVNTIRNISLSAVLGISILIIFIVRKSRVIREKNKILQQQQVQIIEQMEELQNQKKQLEKANQTKDKFLSIIGHDLRNPFNAISSFVSLVTEHPEMMQPDIIQKYLQLIKDAGNNAHSLLENLLEWAMSQSGDLVLNTEKVSLNYILRGNALLIREMAIQKNISVIEELDDNPQVLIDKNMINTVIRNLLSNALKFTPNGGSIKIKSLIENHQIKISIIDTGIGIAPDQRATLFEPGLSKKGYGGVGSTGLGLILCKDFLSLHGKELRVESEVNIGTTFWFYLDLIN